MKNRTFIPAEELKPQYGVFGHFYSLEISTREVVECRSVLELAGGGLATDYGKLSTHNPDAVFIMMNPGSSKPLVDVNQRIRSKTIHKLKIELVPTKPDTTQYQIMRIMHFQGWRHVRVLNLSDIRSPKSPEFIKTFQRLENDFGFEAHSVFSDQRYDELLTKLPRRRHLPIVLAWGLSDRLAPLIERCMKQLPKGKKFFGLIQSGTTHRYRHPLPSLIKNQRRWVDEMMEQFDNA